jgi:hypothetical protein
MASFPQCSQILPHGTVYFSCPAATNLIARSEFSNTVCDQSYYMLSHPLPSLERPHFAISDKKETQTSIEIRELTNQRQFSRNFITTYSTARVRQYS